MNNEKQKLSIAILSVTAVVLLVGVMLSVGRVNTVSAEGILDRGGDYIMVTGQFSDSSELIYVTDAAAQRMNVYSYEHSNRQFEMWDSIDLRRQFNAVGP